MQRYEPIAGRCEMNVDRDGMYYRVDEVDAEIARLRKAIKGWADVIEIQDMRADAADAVTVAQVIVKEMRAVCRLAEEG